MNFIQSVRTCFRKYVRLKGRATRSEFWWFQLFAIALTVAATMFDSAVLGFNWLEATITPFALIVAVTTLLPYASVTARRLHDIGWSGWWQFPMYGSYVVYLEIFFSGISDTNVVGGLLIVSSIYSLGLLIMFIKDSQAQPNKHGPNPKSPSMGEVFS